MPRIFQHEQAKRDLVECFIYLAENSSTETAERFLTSAETSFNELAKNPLIGSTLTLRSPELANMRKWCVNDFNNILIFYVPRHDGISVVRVIHAAQDWWKILDIQ